MVERVNSFSIAQMQSNLGAAVSLDSTGHSVKNVIIYTMYLITFAFCYACVSIYLFRYTFIIKTYYMYKMFRLKCFVTVRPPYVHIAFTCALRSTPFALTAYKALTVRSEYVYFALTVHSLIVHLDNITFRQIPIHTCK